MRPNPRTMSAFNGSASSSSIISPTGTYEVMSAVVKVPAGRLAADSTIATDGADSLLAAAAAAAAIDNEFNRSQTVMPSLDLIGG